MSLIKNNGLVKLIGLLFKNNLVKKIGLIKSDPVIVQNFAIDVDAQDAIDVDGQLAFSQN